MNTKVVEEGRNEEFLMSWDEVIQFYIEQSAIEDSLVKNEHLIGRYKHSHTKRMLDLTYKLRSRYSNKVRAGTQLTSLVLSRSAKHGLSENQARIRIWLNRFGQIEVESKGLHSNDNFVKKVNVPNDQLTDLIDSLLEFPVE